jgi:molybdopterin/thiamine biosynthesis adenylyltransferase
VFINSTCARTRRTWVDGAIEGLSGIVRVFSDADATRIVFGTLMGSSGTN